MSCPAMTNKGGKLSISRLPVPCELTLPELALLDYAVVPSVGSIGDTGIEQDITSYSTVNAGISPQSKAAAVGKVWDVEMLESQSEARDILEAASAVGNKDTYATRIEWSDGAVEFSIVQVSSPTYVKGAPSGVRIVRYTMIPSFIPIVTSSLPVASNVAIGGIPFIGATLAATYSYYSPLGLPESGTEYQWYADGVAIPGETSTSLLVTGGHLGSLITFGVTPSDGLSYGHEAISVSVGPVADSARFTADAPDLYTDTALTVPVTSYGDAVAGWRGGVLVGVQPTLTARPAYGRMPESGVRNLLNASNDFDNTAWAKIAGGTGSAPVVTSDYADGPPELGEIRASRLQCDRGAGNTASDQSWIANTLPAQPNPHDCAISIWVRTTSGAGSQNVAFRPSGTGGAPQSMTVTGEWQRIPHSYTVLSTVAGVQIGTRGTLNSDNQIDILVCACQFEVGLEMTDTQIRTAAYDVTQPGVPDTPILYYDLGDDVLPAAMELPEVTGGTLVIAGEKGIWIEDSFNHAGGSWSLGPTTYTGGPAGLLPSLIGNRALGFAVLEGQLTPAELQVEVAYWMDRGAPGVWNAGSNVFVPPFTLSGGWTDNMDDTYTHAGPIAGVIQGQGTAAIGDIWMFAYTVSGRTAGNVRADGVGVSGASFTGNGAVRELLVAPAAGGTPRFLGSAAFDGTLSGAEINLLTLNTDPYP